MPELEVIQVIHTKLKREGLGTPDDPMTVIEQFWSMDGELLWEIDPRTQWVARGTMRVERER